MLPAKHNLCSGSQTQTRSWKLVRKTRTPKMPFSAILATKKKTFPSGRRIGSFRPRKALAYSGYTCFVQPPSPQPMCAKLSKGSFASSFFTCRTISSPVKRASRELSISSTSINYSTIHTNRSQAVYVALDNSFDLAQNRL